MPSRRRVVRVLVSLAIGVAIASAVVWRMMWMPPAWYSPPAMGDPHVLRLADDVEYRFIEEAHRPRATGEPWTIRLREHQANAWLAARLRKWIEFEQGMDWPQTLGTPQVRINGETIDLACDVRTSAGRRFVVVQFVPTMQDERLTVSASGVALGRIALRSVSVDRVASLIAPQRKAEFLESEIGAALISALTASAAVDPEVGLSDGRRLRLRAVSIHEGALDLTFVTMSDE